MGLELVVLLVVLLVTVVLRLNSHDKELLLSCAIRGCFITLISGLMLSGLTLSNRIVCKSLSLSLSFDIMFELTVYNKGSNNFNFNVLRN